MSIYLQKIGVEREPSKFWSEGLNPSQLPRLESLTFFAAQVPPHPLAASRATAAFPHGTAPIVLELTPGGGHGKKRSQISVRDR